MPDGAFRLVSAALFVLAGTCGVVSPASAQGQEASPRDVQGAIAGVVVDAKTGETLPGANVSIKGTTTGTATDLNGRYRLGGLQPGAYDVVFSFVGFQSKTVTGVEVTAGSTTRLEVTLSEQAAQLDEVVVSAAAARDSEAGLLKQRSRAASVVNAISAETIGKSGSSTAADAIEKITGASVTDGKFVNVRGLGGRYVNTQINGAELPSSDPNKNAVPLDLFPASLLDNISTSKTFTPDQPGNFTGGNVNLTTKSFPDEQTINVSTSVAYHSETRFNKILRPNGTLGNIPGSVSPLGEEGSQVPSIAEALGSSEKRQLLDDISSDFGAGRLTPGSRPAPVNQSYSASYGDQFDIFGGQTLGLVAGAKYSWSTSATRERLSAEAGTGPQNVDFSFNGASGSTEETLGGLANVSYKPSPNHEISVNGLYNQTDQRSAVFLNGRIPRDGAINVRRYRLEPIVRSLWTVQGQGNHLIGGGGGGPRIEWNSTYSQTTQDERDVRFLTDDRDDRGNYDISTAIYEAPTRYFRDLTEFTWSNDLSLSVPIPIGNVKVGGSYLYKERDLDERRFIYDNFDAYDGDPGTFFSVCTGIIEENGPCHQQYEGNRIPAGFNGPVIQERTRGQNSLVGDRTVGAGFAMIDTQVPGVSNLRFIGGVRAEYTDQFIKTRDDSTGQIRATDVLPSANLVFSLRENMNIRAAYGRTVARPTFREFSPATYYDFKRQELVDGETDLRRSTVNNFDLRWEWFPRPGELFAVSGYYKDFDAPIERVIDERANNREVTYQNQKSAQVYGAEVEARKRLGFIAAPLRYLEVGGNFTLTSSSVTAPSGQDLGRPLEGQSDYLVNGDLSYDNPETGTTVSVYYNYFADRLNTIERQNQPDQYERGRHTIDLVASQRLPYGVEVKASVKNALNEAYEVYQDFEDEFTTVRYEQGRTISIGISYNL